MGAMKKLLFISSSLMATGTAVSGQTTSAVGLSDFDSLSRDELLQLPPVCRGEFFHPGSILGWTMTICVRLLWRGYPRCLSCGGFRCRDMPGNDQRAASQAAAHPVLTEFRT